MVSRRLTKHWVLYSSCAQALMRLGKLYLFQNPVVRMLHPTCRMDLPGSTTSVGTRTDYSVGPWDYPACATRHLKAWSTMTTQE
jgi:hypothetical protein